MSEDVRYMGDNNITVRRIYSFLVQNEMFNRFCELHNIAYRPSPPFH